jgi:hypothetical protein
MWEEDANNFNPEKLGFLKLGGNRFNLEEYSRKRLF